jgi:hypothetical protein
LNLTPNTKNVQDPDIAVTGNGHVYVTINQGATISGQPNAIVVAKSTDCGRTFSKPTVVTTFIPYDAQDRTLPGGYARDCGDFDNACQSGFTFFRRVTTPRSTADQSDKANEWVYVAFDATKPGTEVDTLTTYGSIQSGRASQGGVYFARLDGASGAVTTAALIDSQSVGHQLFPDISADDGILHAIWWDSRADPNYSPLRPVGNDASGNVVPSLDVWYAKSTNGGASWTDKAKLTDSASNPNFEQFSNRSVPFAGDYLWISSVGSFAFAAWTDWRNVLPGADPRQPGDTTGADVNQCRVLSAITGWSSDQCPRDGGLDQNIYGAAK